MTFMMPLYCVIFIKNC